MPKTEDNTICAGEELTKVLQEWDPATDETKHKMLTLIFEAVYYDSERALIVAIKPKPQFLPLLNLCNSLEQKEGLFYPDFTS